MWEDDEEGNNFGQRMVNHLTGRGRAVRPATASGGAPAEEPPAEKENAGKTQLTIFGLVILAWLLGAGIGFITQRPHAVATLGANPTPVVTTTPTVATPSVTVTTPKVTATP